jgi:hypothetical protein
MHETDCSLLVSLKILPTRSRGSHRRKGQFWSKAELAQDTNLVQVDIHEQEIGVNVTPAVNYGGRKRGPEKTPCLSRSPGKWTG